MIWSSSNRARERWKLCSLALLVLKSSLYFILIFLLPLLYVYREMLSEILQLAVFKFFLSITKLLSLFSPPPSSCVALFNWNNTIFFLLFFDRYVFIAAQQTGTWSFFLSFLMFHNKISFLITWYFIFSFLKKYYPNYYYAHLWELKIDLK